MIRNQIILHSVFIISYDPWWSFLSTVLFSVNAVEEWNLRAMKAPPQNKWGGCFPCCIKRLWEVANEALLPWEAQLSIVSLSKGRYAQRVLWKVLCKILGVFLGVIGEWKKKNPFMHLLYSWVKFHHVEGWLSSVCLSFGRVWEAAWCRGECAGSGGHTESQPSSATK